MARAPPKQLEHYLTDVQRADHDGKGKTDGQKIFLPKDWAELRKKKNDQDWSVTDVNSFFIFK